MGLWPLQQPKLTAIRPVTHIRHLNLAPITEAVIDFRVKAAANFRAEDLLGLKQQLSDRFPVAEERRGGQVIIGFKPGLPAVQSKDFGLQGYFFKSKDDKLIAQFRIDGFTLNRLAPYTSWDDLYPLAIELWGHYRTTATPQLVTRLALRFINHIPLPFPFVDFDEYLRAGPVVPTELPQHTPAFDLQTLIHNSENGISANVRQRLETSLEDQRHTVILDIDAFKSVEIPPDDPSIQITFEQLRNFKNMIFFNYLTEETLRRFE